MVAKASPLWRLGCQLYLLPEDSAEDGAVRGKLAFARHLHWHDDDEDGALTYPEFLAAMHVVGGLQNEDIEALYDEFAVEEGDAMDIEELLGGFLMTDFVRISTTARRRLLAFVERCLALKGLPPEVDVTAEADLAAFMFTLRGICDQQLDDLDLELVYSLFQVDSLDSLSWRNFLLWCAGQSPKLQGLASPFESETASQSSSLDSALAAAAAASERHRQKPHRKSQATTAAAVGVTTQPQRRERQPPVAAAVEARRRSGDDSSDGGRLPGGRNPGDAEEVRPIRAGHGHQPRRVPQVPGRQVVVVRKGDPAPLTGAVQVLERTLRDHEQRLVQRQGSFERRLDQRLAAVGAELAERLGERIVTQLAGHLDRQLEARFGGLAAQQQLNAELERRQRLDAEADLRFALDEERGRRLALEFALQTLQQLEPLPAGGVGKRRHRERQRRDRTARRTSSLTAPSSVGDPRQAPPPLPYPPTTPPPAQPAATVDGPPEVPLLLFDEAGGVPAATADAPAREPAAAAKDVATQPPRPSTTLPISAATTPRPEGPLPAKVAAVLARSEFAELRRLPAPQLRRMFGRWDKLKTGCINFHGFCQLLLDASDHRSDLTEVQMERVFSHFGDHTFEVLTWDQFQQMLSVPVRAASVSPTRAGPATPPASAVPPPEDHVGNVPRLELSYPLRPELLQRPEMVALRRLPPPQLRHLFKQLARDVGTINHHQYMDLVRTSTPADPTLSDSELLEIYRHFADPSTGFMTLDRFVKSIHPAAEPTPFGRLTPRRTTSPREPHRPGPKPRHAQDLHAALVERCYHPARTAPIQGTLALLRYGRKGGHRGRVGVGDFATLLEGLGVTFGPAEVEGLFQQHAQPGPVVDWDRFVERLRMEQRLGLSGAEFHRLLGIIRAGFAEKHRSPADPAQFLAPFHIRDPQLTGRIRLIPFTEVVQTHCNQRLTDYEVELVFNRLADDRLQELQYLAFVDAMCNARTATDP